MNNLIVKVLKQENNKKNPLATSKDFVYFPDKKLLEIYIGKAKDISENELRKKVSDVNWKDFEADEVRLDTKGLSSREIELVYEMISLKSKVFEAYKVKSDKRKDLKAVKSSTGKKIVSAEREKLVNAVNYCRDLVSSNASEVHPAFMEAEAKALAAKCPDIKVKVINATQAEKLGMGCLLAVGAESIANHSKEYHPRLVVLEFNPVLTKSSAKAEHLAIVGKGITYDTGGLCLKPTNYMLDMKSDMAGSATVLSLFKMISTLSLSERKKIKKKITGVLALAENAFGNMSYKPGDVLKAANAKTVQVVDTDAEGRLALADGLAYLGTLRSKPDFVVDLATLTGSIVATLGEVAAGAMTNDEDFLKSLTGSFDEEGERLWHMPILEDCKKKTESSIADLAHCSTRPDALIAAQFLSNFIPENSKWVHLDIAGVGFIENDGLFAYKGATGFGVKGLFRYIYS